MSLDKNLYSPERQAVRRPDMQHRLTSQPALLVARLNDNCTHQQCHGLDVQPMNSDEELERRPLGAGSRLLRSPFVVSLLTVNLGLL